MGEAADREDVRLKIGGLKNRKFKRVIAARTKERGNEEKAVDNAFSDVRLEGSFRET